MQAPMPTPMTGLDVAGQLFATVDGQPVTAPSSVVSVEGVIRALGVVSPQTSGATTYQFQSWSDGGAATHDITTPVGNTTYTATYVPSTGTMGTGLSATYYDNIDFTGSTVTRVDPTVDFNWGTGSPAPAIGLPSSTSGRRRADGVPGGSRSIDSPPTIRSLP